MNLNEKIDIIHLINKYDDYITQLVNIVDSLLDVKERMYLENRYLETQEELSKIISRLINEIGERVYGFLSANS